MHIDARDIEQNSTVESDICIAGAGAAGITMALRLAGTGLDVCLLESGELDTSGEARDLYAGKNVGRSYYPLSASRLRFFGGTTNHWAGYCRPLDSIDFEERSWVPYSGWPISRTDLEPYYREARRICKLSSFDLSHWEDVFDQFERWPLNSLRLQTQAFQVKPLRFGKTYRDDIIKAPNITLITHANLTEIETPPSARAVSGYKVETLEGSQFTVSAQRYVLACGGIENARLLLLSDRHAPRGLGNENDLVGRFFMEHPGMPTAHVVRSSASNVTPYWQHWNAGAQDAAKLSFRLSLPEAVQRENRISNARINISGKSPYASTREVFWRLRRQRLRFGADIGDIADEIETVLGDFEGLLSDVNRVLRGDRPVEDRAQVLQFDTWIEQAPNPKSRVTLDNETDALGQRRVKLDWQLSELDRHTVESINRLAAREFGRLGWGRLRLHNWLQHNEGEWPAELRGGFHHMGTTRMSESPSRGVCNADSAVHGVDNLHLAGSSVFPTVGHANPTFTIVALSVRLADHLRNSLPR